LYRMRGTPRDLVNAAQFYRDALSSDTTMIEAQRGLGLTLIRSGQADEGRTHIRAYLDANPTAADAEILRSLLPTTGQ
jgi:beta-barrel assembly-enhancing protease